MINNSKDIGELIKKLKTPSGRASAVIALSKQYQVPEENVREAITTLEAAYDSNAAQRQDQRIESLLSAANLARKILWIEKAVDLTAKAGRKSAAAEMAEEFGLDTKALALYKETDQLHKAVDLAGKLKNWDAYIALCKQNRDYAAAITKCKELGREEEAKNIFTEMFGLYTSQYGDHDKLVATVEKTGLVEQAIEMCQKQNKLKILAKIAAKVGRPELAMECFEKTAKYLEAARQAVLMIAQSSEYSKYINKARELYLKEAEKLESAKQYHDAVHILRETADKTGIRDEEVQNRIFTCYLNLGTNLAEEGAKFFESIGCVDKALSLYEQAGKFVDARAIAKSHGIADKVKEYTQKLGWNENLAEIALEEGHFDQAIACYISEIEKQAGKHDWQSAETALKAAELCKKHDKKELAEKFQKQAKEFFAIEAESYEKMGYWERAAEFAEKAGNTEKAKLYSQINALAKAYIMP